MTWEQTTELGNSGAFSEEVWMTASNNGGGTWSEPAQASAPGGTSWFPRVAAAGSRGWLTWQEGGGVMVREIAGDAFGGPARQVAAAPPPARPTWRRAGRTYTPCGRRPAAASS